MYTDPKTPEYIKLKVGRAVNLVKRIDQWGKQCGSKEQVLRGWWPGTVEPDSDGPGGGVSLMKGRVHAGEQGAWCHRVERLVHLELADLAAGGAYLEEGFRAARGGSTGASASASVGKGGGSTPRKGAAGKRGDKPCADCACFFVDPVFGMGTTLLSHVSCLQAVRCTKRYLSLGGWRRGGTKGRNGRAL